MHVMSEETIISHVYRISCLIFFLLFSVWLLVRRTFLIGILYYYVGTISEEFLEFCNKPLKPSRIERYSDCLLHIRLAIELKIFNSKLEFYLSDIWKYTIKDYSGIQTPILKTNYTFYSNFAKDFCLKLQHNYLLFILI